ncbi:glycoside hydrolase family 43 protein [Paenibacillus sp. FSL H8-0457]|uniref:glycoside hydrolase family 43 protein n=1 Tax=Paenibacillus TaxID=44249 RepID=UPI0003E1EF90|nr:MULTISPECIES: glycoside hydrolase family 43 protein [Paenibacillus]ETT68543.1 alpha-N-arabinofuranosidase [Paenibacillus sp. FSL H8-457]MCM3259513.1 glycoside hydrolase family 43 protein [Paenibacillus lautus]
MSNRTTTFSNPIVANAADPWVLKHTDGYYYFMSTQPGRLELTRSSTLTGLAEGRRKTIWSPEPGGPYSYNLWAPEIHDLNDKWYIYYTANDGGGDESRGLCVLENEHSDPLEGEWVWKGAMKTPVPGLDGTVMTVRNRLYFLYAGYGHFPEYGSAIYIAQMANPWTLTGEHRLLTAPTLTWEKQGGMAINEGPVTLHRNGRIFLVYSASTTWSEDYALGMLTMDEDADPMDPASWQKSMEPVFRKSIENGVYATGHNSFTRSPDDQEDWIVFHALPSADADASIRSTRIQKFGWKLDGTPDFGVPWSDAHHQPVPSGE